MTVDAWQMWAIAAGAVALPYVLMYAFNGHNKSDSRGRRLDRKWRAHH